MKVKKNISLTSTQRFSWIPENFMSIMFLCFIIFFAFFRTIDLNPDTDAYFLIENGRYIFENKNVPNANPWSIIPGIGIIIQQPLCSLLNYFGYCIFGLKKIWILAAIENIILLTSVYFLCSLFTKDLSRRLLSVGLFELFLTCNNYITTRPYQLTMCISIIEIICLYHFFLLSEKTKKDKIKITIQCCLLTLLQVNFQSSFTIMMFIWILCFITFDIRKIKNFHFHTFKNDFKEKIKIGSFLYLCMGITSLFNPNGIHGILYLFKSSSAISLLQNNIAETKSPVIMSATGLCILLVLSGMFLLAKLDKVDSYLLYMGLGTSVMVAFALRNLWTLYIPFIILYTNLIGKVSLYIQKRAKEKLKEKEIASENDFDGLIKEQELTETKKETEKQNNKKSNHIFLSICSLGIILYIFSNILVQKSSDYSQVYKEYAFEDAVAYLDTINKEEITLYTTFNTGAYMEFSGYKIFMDARPELYSPAFTNGPDILDDWYQVNTYKSDINEFINKYDFTHFVVGKHDVFDTYLKYQDIYKKICENESFVLYEKIKNT